jgi:hypothetical protein
MLIVFLVLVLCLTSVLALAVVWEDLFDDGLVFAPLVVAGLALIVLIVSPEYRGPALITVGAFALLTLIGLWVRWTATIHGRLERAYWHKSSQAILANLFRKYGLDERRNAEITQELEKHLRQILPRDWSEVVSTAAQELKAVKVTAARVRSLGISRATAESYARTTVHAGDALWLVTERVAAVHADGYFSEVVVGRLAEERQKVENLINAAESAREALAQLTLGDASGQQLESAELQLRALADATRELEII